MFKYVHLPADVPISIPTGMTRFKCLILIEREISNDYRNEVSAALVAAGCLYALAWGLDCSIWDDAVDWAFLEHYDYGEYPEDKFVMTTWHDNETLEETVDFAKHCTEYSNVKLDDILVLDFSKQERSDFIQKLYSDK
ncbi:hypothetical protein RSK20926_03414 [Roseobacter sp. SK209-2-6]|uniref:DUF7684 family protein n=1 Tax=Roseobacter sp. SK209-2-6 TaxID=388739 RepID=UPI0000F3ECCD|nr:hypothetical protein [Roseobacter sp. SK209-2-6]EBA16821.1 hypothetical protein RSK20926_03414 [Roseobacter sp. SK209-2-6]